MMATRILGLMIVCFGLAACGPSAVERQQLQAEQQQLEGHIAWLNWVGVGPKPMSENTDMLRSGSIFSPPANETPAQKASREKLEARSDAQFKVQYEKQLVVWEANAAEHKALLNKDQVRIAEIKKLLGEN